MAQLRDDPGAFLHLDRGLHRYGKFRAGPSQSTGFTAQHTAQATRSVLSARLALAGRDMTLRDGLPPGPYFCRWLVDGVELGRRPFTVAGD